MAKLNHTAYCRMAIHDTNELFHSAITLFNAYINFRPSCLSVEQYFAAVLLSVSESLSPLPLPLQQKALLRVVSHPVREWKPNRPSERIMITALDRSATCLLRKETL